MSVLETHSYPYEQENAQVEKDELGTIRSGREVPAFQEDSLGSSGISNPADHLHGRHLILGFSYTGLLK